MNPLEWDAPVLVVCLALAVIVTMRASATYAVGRGLIAGAAHTRFARRMNGPAYRRATELVARYGAPVVALCFLTVGFQTAVLLAAGALRMPLRRFVPGLVVGSLLWGALYGTVGFVGFRLAVTLYRFSPPLAIGLAVALVAGLAGFIWWHRIRRPEEVPEAAASVGESGRTAA